MTDPTPAAPTTQAGRDHLDYLRRWSEDEGATWTDFDTEEMGQRILAIEAEARDTARREDERWDHSWSHFADDCPVPPQPSAQAAGHLAKYGCNVYHADGPCQWQRAYSAFHPGSRLPSEEEPE